MKKFVLFIVLIAFAQLIEAQERYFDERYITTHHFVNPVLINPGAIGTNDMHQVMFNYRNKWASFPGAPKSLFANYDGPIGNNLSLGLGFLSDKAGNLRTTKGQIGLNYKLMTKTNKVGFGITGEYISHGISLDNFSGTIDPVVQERLDGIEFFDVSFGIHGVYDNTIIYGLTLPSLVSARLDDEDSTLDKEFSMIAYLGYRWKIEDYDLVVEPSVFVKQLSFVPLHIDANIKAEFLEGKLTGGLTYTVGADERLGFLIGTRINKLNFYYTYNVSRHDFQTYNNGSHELSFKIDIMPGSLVNDDEKDMIKEVDDIIEP